MTKFDRLALMAAILCVANETAKKGGSGVSDHDLKQSADQAVRLHQELEKRVGQEPPEEEGRDD